MMRRFLGEIVVTCLGGQGDIEVKCTERKSLKKLIVINLELSGLVWPARPSIKKACLRRVPREHRYGEMGKEFDL